MVSRLISDCYYSSKLYLVQNGYTGTTAPNNVKPELHLEMLFSDRGKQKSKSTCKTCLKITGSRGLKHLVNTTGFDSSNGYLVRPINHSTQHDFIELKQAMQK